MAAPDTSSWTPAGQTSNVRYFTVEPGILAGVAIEGSSDDADTALENAKFHNAYFREHGPGVLLIFAETGMSQDRAARRVYQEMWDRTVCLGAAFVGASMLVRAMAAFFVGFTRIEAPFTQVDNLDAALAWAKSIRDHRVA